MIDVTKNILKDIYKPRPQESKKYDFGSLIVVGGSDFYSGSPALSAMAAFRAGCDMVSVIAPQRAADIIASFSPDLAAYPLPGKQLLKEHLAVLLSMTESVKTAARGKTAIVIGGGAGRSQETQEVISEFISETSVPAVVDADAIHALAKNPSVISGKKILVTPHAFEFFILTGKEVEQLKEEEKIKTVQQEAARLQTTILLKGAVDIISDGQSVALNKIGSPFLTVGGTGDTLAGIAGALLARGVSPFVAGQAAAFINVQAGKLAGAEHGESMMATDLINAISKAIR